MPLTDSEFTTILEDEKWIQDGITWSNYEDNAWAQVFRAEVKTDTGWPLFVQGWYNPKAQTLTYALILRTEGRIYGLDLGKDHHNPQCNQVGEKHKHKWSEQHRDKEAYVPGEITATVHDPVAVWVQFYEEAKIEHQGEVYLPLRQQELF